MIFSPFNIGRTHGFEKFHDILRSVKYIRLSVTETLLFKRKREDSSSTTVKLIVQCNPEHDDDRLYKNSPLTWATRQVPEGSAKCKCSRCVCNVPWASGAAPIHIDNLNEFWLIILSEAAEILSDASSWNFNNGAFSASTRWNVTRHKTRSTFINEISFLITDYKASQVCKVSLQESADFK